MDTLPVLLGCEFLKPFFVYIEGNKPLGLHWLVHQSFLWIGSVVGYALCCWMYGFSERERTWSRRIFLLTLLWTSIKLFPLRDRYILDLNLEWIIPSLDWQI